jgi:hypothetical protein
VCAETGGVAAPGVRVGVWVWVGGVQAHSCTHPLKFQHFLIQPFQVYRRAEPGGGMLWGTQKGKCDSRVSCMCPQDSKPAVTAIAGAATSGI